MVSCPTGIATIYLAFPVFSKHECLLKEIYTGLPRNVLCVVFLAICLVVDGKPSSRIATRLLSLRKYKREYRGLLSVSLTVAASWASPYPGKLITPVCGPLLCIMCMPACHGVVVINSFPVSPAHTWTGATLQTTWLSSLEAAIHLCVCSSQHAMWLDSPPPCPSTAWRRPSERVWTALRASRAAQTAAAGKHEPRPSCHDSGAVRCKMPRPRTHGGLRCAHDSARTHTQAHIRIRAQHAHSPDLGIQRVVGCALRHTGGDAAPLCALHRRRPRERERSFCSRQGSWKPLLDCVFVCT